MSTHYEDEAQVEALRRWIKENWKPIALGLGLGLALIFGWEAWTQSKENTRAEASQLFDELETAVTAKEYDEAVKIADLLIADFSSTPYAAIGALKMAQAAVDAGKLDDARARLDWAASNGDDVALAPLIRLRQARVVWQQGKPADALALLDAETSTEAKEYAALYGELRGDIKLAEGDRAAAYAAYKQAMETIGPDSVGSPNAPIGDALQRKLDDLADAAPVRS